MNDFDSIIECMAVTRMEPGDYTGEDGLLYCGKCHTAKAVSYGSAAAGGLLAPLPLPL